MKMKYTYPVDHLFTGSSLGNHLTFAQLDEVTNLLGLWSSADNQFYLGAWIIDLKANRKEFTPHSTTFEPESQTTVLQSALCKVEKQLFLPFSTQLQAGVEETLRAAIYLIRLSNHSPDKTTITLTNTLTFPAISSAKFTKKPPDDQTGKKVNIHKQSDRWQIVTEGSSSEVRLLWTNRSEIESEHDERSLRVSYSINLASGESQEIPFVLTFSPEGSEAAARTLRHAQHATDLLQQSRAEYANLLSRSHVFTPDPMINRGLQWSKVNTARVQHKYRCGEGFTNDPPQDIIVIRDLGWYVLGSNYLTPEFSRGLLSLAGQHAFHESGKLTEFIRADESRPELHDYNLNINDDTPLYVYGLYHYAVTCGDEDFLRHTYPLMKRACDYIISQINNGLVRCYADGTNVWGICSWRNIIDGYNLTGAVTEINAECYYALKLLSEVARVLQLESDERFYFRVAEELKQQINSNLISEESGLYLLNLANDGVRHHDVTGDLIFPVMFEVADDVVRRRILAMLLSDEFWTPYGTRTVSPKESNYDPDFGYQLVGGVWPNLTAWTAYCVRRENPEKLVEGMRNTYRLSETKTPRQFVNVVPGEFPERLHGESFISRGMTMSPWMPPTYLWLGVEGLMGVKPTLAGLEMHPAIPSSWKWIAVKNLLYKNEHVDAFLHEGTLYSTRALRSEFPLKVGTPVRSSASHDGLFSIAMMIENHVALFIAADEEVSGIVTIESQSVRVDKEVRLAAGESQLFFLPTTNEVPSRTEAVSNK